ncbi:cytotoxic T-lymphocyte protein 4 [Esox lucius]|uniref:Immunoglobulin V-set domain-containing protein n=1 Tax=Esox lucius TaxID=8010 RepID=A0AAY5KP73_ESOLU|nr:cytotoxic T-lymphocyte protein 4 [Esox lucius]
MPLWRMHYSSISFQNDGLYKSLPHYSAGPFHPVIMSLALLTGLCLCLPTWNALTVFQTYRAVSQDGEVQFCCSYNHIGRHVPEELRVTLYRGLFGEEEEQEVCTSSFSHNQTLFQTKGERGGVGAGDRETPVLCRGQVEAGMVNLTISGLRGNDTDLYRCAIEVMYPPPYLRVFGNGTLLYIPEEPDCPALEPKRRDDSGSLWTRPPLVSVAWVSLLLMVVSNVAFVLYQVLQRKKRFGGIAPMISQNDGRFGYGNFQ